MNRRPEGLSDRHWGFYSASAEELAEPSRAPAQERERSGGLENALRRGVAEIADSVRHELVERAAWGHVTTRDVRDDVLRSEGKGPEHNHDAFWKSYYSLDQTPERTTDAEDIELNAHERDRDRER